MKILYHFAADLISPDFLPTPDGGNIPGILDIVFGIFGAIAVLMVVYSGIQLIISQGNSEKVAQARRSIIYSVVGLIIAIFSWTIVSFVVERLQSGT